MIAGYRNRRHDIRHGHRDDHDRQGRHTAREGEDGAVRLPAQNTRARAPATTPVAAPASVIVPASSPTTNGTGDLDPGPAVTPGGGRGQ